MKWVAAALVVAAAIVAIRFLPVAEGVERLSEFTAELGWIGPAVFGVTYVLASLGLVPGSLLTLAAGAVFGLVVGVITVILSATTAAALAFLIARYLLRERVARYASKSPKFLAIDRAIEQGGWRVVALLRLSPAVPFTIANYLFGLTNVRFTHYVGSSLIAMLPGTFLYIYLGYAGRESAASSGRSPAEWALLAVGLAATLFVTIYVSRLAKRALAESATAEVPEDPEDR